MKKIAFLLPLALLAACGEEPAPEPTEAAAPAPEPTHSLAVPDEELFATVFAEACPGAEPVATSFCQHAMGATTAQCEFGLGDDEVLRNDATIEVDETGESWQLADAEATCSQFTS